MRELIALSVFIVVFAVGMIGTAYRWPDHYGFSTIFISTGIALVPFVLILVV